MEKSETTQSSSKFLGIFWQTALHWTDFAEMCVCRLTQNKKNC